MHAMNLSTKTSVLFLMQWLYFHTLRTPSTCYIPSEQSTDVAVNPQIPVGTSIQRFLVCFYRLLPILDRQFVRSRVQKVSANNVL